jgi:uncharacterized membrane protein
MTDENQRTPRILWLISLIFSAVVIADSSFRWATFQYRTFDLAFYAHTFWLALRGSWHSSLLDVSLMGNHAEPICFLLLPLYWLWKHPMFFVVVQALLVATMPFTGFRIARQMKYGVRGALGLALATLVVPAAGYMVLHEFHPETLAAPFLLLMLEARLNERARAFWVWFVLATACKENVALLLVAFCLTFCLIDWKRGLRWQFVFNIAPCLVAGTWLAGYLLWLAPILNAGHVDYAELYTQSGGLAGLATSPVTAIKAAWNATINGNLTWGLLLSCGLLPLLRPRWLVIGAPIFAQHLLSSRSSEWTIYFHYAAPLVPLMWYATAEAGARFDRRDLVAGFALAAAVVCQVWLGPVWSVAQTVKTARVMWDDAQLRSEFVAAIPEEASVVAGLPYLSHLTNRERLHSLHHILKGLRTLSRANYVPPAPTDAVLVDATDTATFDRAAGYYHPTMRTIDERIIADSDVLLDEFLAQASWHRLSRNGLSLFVRGEPSPAKPALGQGTRLDNYHRLVAAHFAPARPGDAALIVLTLEIEPNRQFLPWVSLVLRDADGREQRITRGPIGLGLPAGQVNESWAIRPSSGLRPGRTHAFLLFYDRHEAVFPADRQRFQQCTIDLGEMP